VTDPFDCSISAATPAACGAAAEVPKKLGKLRLFWHSARPEPMLLRTKPRKVLLTPSGPTKSGFWRTTGVASFAPLASNRIGEPPCEE
jgi:hypothetical protein